MDFALAKEIIALLADGVDSTTGEILPQDSVYDSPDVIRALFVALRELDSVAKRKLHLFVIKANHGLK